MKISRRKENTIVFFKNFIMTATVLGVVSVLIFLTQGWRLDEKFEVQRTGLVQFNSSIPNSISEIDKKPLPEGTPTKNLATPGRHEFSIWKEGYQTWWRQTEVRVGEILWLNYARLVPKKITEKSFLNVPNLKNAFVAPDKKKIFAISEDSNSEAVFWLIDISDREPKISKLNFNSNIFERNNQTSETSGKDNFYKIADNLKVSKISNDNKKAIVSFNNGEKLDWLILNFENPTESINLTQKFHIDFSKLAASSDDANKFVGLSGADLREINISNNTISAAFLNNIVDFEIYDKENIAYIQKNVKKGEFSVGVRRGDKNNETTSGLKNQPKIAIGRYYRESYLYVAEGLKVNIYKSASWSDGLQLIKVLNVGFMPDYLKLNGESRILIAKKGNNVYSYDLETRNNYTYTSVDGDEIKWLDDFVLGEYSEGKLVISDFDSMNRHVLSKGLADFPFTISANNKFIYTFIKNDNGTFSINRMNMTTEE